tara:strand:- start:505 stop:756 length:252 start_codon:yes stop_codon:yes gene_type:complete
MTISTAAVLSLISLSSTKPRINCPHDGEGRGCPTCLNGLIDKVDMMTEALRAIVAHQESIGGGLAIMSATHRIAQAALDVGSE